jgi:Uma2 family endonuclease
MPSSAHRRATLADLIALADRGRAVELIDGEIIEKAVPTPEHGAAQVKLGEILGPFHRKLGGPRGPGGWWFMSEVEVLYPTGDDVYRHDLAGFRRERCPARPTGWPVRERADWVCEILSASTARYDIVEKQRTLHAHGVPHYWILHPEDETLMVLRHGPDGYVNVLNAGTGDVVRAEPFDAIAIDVGELFGHEAEEPQPR